MRKAINVQPLRTTGEIQDMMTAIKRGKGGKKKRQAIAERDVMLFRFGINTGLRVSDILGLTVDQVKDKDFMKIKEQKTGKWRTVNLKGIKDEIQAYTEGKSGYLFPSQKGGQMTVTQAYRILTDAGDLLDRDDIGTHTMRKTFGYHYYKKTQNVAALQDMLNHSTPATTRAYIGITQDDINESLEGFRLG